MAKNKRPRARYKVKTTDNDNLAAALSDLVPDAYVDTDRYLNVVQWNIEWFGATKSKAKDLRRWGLVLEILQALNADLFIFQEIAGPTADGRRPGALDEIADELTRLGAGDYAVDYTLAGGEQRVAMMWDRDSIRAKTDVAELFERSAYKPDGEPDPFAGRTPLYGYFSCEVEEFGKFDFQALGVHLKAMAEGHDQRLDSAKILAEWMSGPAREVDADILIMGDWNAPPADKCWKPFHDLEKKSNGDAEVFFRRINDPSDYSYLWLRNKKDSYVSRIDLTALSLSSDAAFDPAADQLTVEAGGVIYWKPIQEVLREAAALTDSQVRDVLAEVKETISDHLPTVTRFYVTRKGA